jgi:hypothetical protein
MSPGQRRRRRRIFSLRRLLAYLTSDPAVRIVLVAVVINLMVRLMELAFSNPWDSMIQNALGFYTVVSLVQVISRLLVPPSP